MHKIIIVGCSMLFQFGLGKAKDNVNTLQDGPGLKTVFFELREMDMHIHAGMERELPLDEWIDISLRDGRKMMFLLDHRELYRMDQKEHNEWIKDRKFIDWYPIKSDGYKALMNDFKKG